MHALFAQLVSAYIVLHTCTHHILMPRERVMYADCKMFSLNAEWYDVDDEDSVHVFVL